jgi:hypothetical protein
VNFGTSKRVLVDRCSALYEGVNKCEYPDVGWNIINLHTGLAISVAEEDAIGVIEEEEKPLTDLADCVLNPDSKKTGVSVPVGNADNWDVAHRFLNHRLGLCHTCR